MSQDDPQLLHPDYAPVSYGQSGSGAVHSLDLDDYRLALDALGAMVFDWEVPSGRVTRSKEIENLLGFSLSEAQPNVEWWRGRVHPADQSHNGSQFETQIAARAAHFIARYRIRHKDGRWVHAIDKCKAIYDNDGAIRRVIGCTIDVSDRAELEESNVGLSAIVLHSADAVFAVTLDGRVSTWNPGAERLYGYQSQEIIGADLRVLVPEKLSAESQSVVARVQDGETVFIQSRRLAKGGIEVPVTISAAPIRAADGRIIGISTIHRDISALRTIEHENARLAAIVAASSDAIIGVSLNGNISSWNSGAEQLFGWSADQAIGMAIANLIPDTRKHEHEDAARKLLDGGSFVLDTVRKTRDGREVPVSASFTPLFMAERLVGIASIYRDISDRIARETHVDFIMKELLHRSKNLLAIIQGIARQTALRSTNFDTFTQTFSSRLRGLSQSHDILVQRNWHGAEMHDLVRTQIEPFADIGAEAVRIDGPHLILRPDAAQNIGMALHELAANALKHGSLAQPNGTVTIHWEIDSTPSMRLSWRESATAKPRERGPKGFGQLVTADIAPRALGGQATTSYLGGGLEWTLVAPLDKISA